MTTAYKQLVLNATVDATWDQLLEGPGGAAYDVPTGAQVAIKGVLITNNSATDEVSVDLALASSSSPTADEILRSVTIPAGGHADDDDGVRTMLEGQGFYIRPNGTSPDVTIHVSVLEVS